jgi:hypothetical protein
MVHWWVLGHSGPRITYAPKTWFSCELQLMKSFSHSLKGFAFMGNEPKDSPATPSIHERKKTNHSHVSCRSNGSYDSFRPIIPLCHFLVFEHTFPFHG